jgi:hypothetical protein
VAPTKEFRGREETDALFRLPLGEFTAARNALAARLKKSGRSDAAVRVKGLQKPSMSAWAVNQLFWQHTREFAALLDAGDRFREAQKAQLAGRKADLRGTLEARREALASMAARASRLLAASGYATTPDLMRRIATTLETLATYGSASAGQAAGTLVDDIQPAGFEALATLIPTGDGNGRTGAPPRVIPFTRRTRAKPASAKATAGKPKHAEDAERRRSAEDAARREAARKALRAAERTLRQAKRDAQQAQRALRSAAPRAKKAERIRAAAEKAFEKATKDAEELTREARRMAQLAEEAAQALVDAEAAVGRFRESLV